MPKVSIIVPVYNVENYLEICIKSILNQTFHDFELVLVDDGSTDSSGKICDFWKTKDERIIIIHKDNGGLSDARNAALDIIKGEFLTFIDSDDAIHCKTIEVLHNEMTEHDADIVSTLFQGFDTIDISNLLKQDLGEYECLVYNCDNSIPNVLFNDYPYLHSACAKLYKATIFKNLRFKKGLIYEDLQLKPYILFYEHLKRIVCTKTSMYFYNCIENHVSIMHSELSEKKISSMLQILYENYQVCKEHKSFEVAAARAYKLVLSFIKVYALSLQNKKYKKYLNKYYFKYLFKITFIPNKYLSAKKKLAFYMTVLPSKKVKSFLKNKYEKELELQYPNNL